MVGGDHAKIFTEIQLSKAKLNKSTKEIEKISLEIELNSSIQNKYKNNLNFLNEARSVIINKKECNLASENKQKMMQVEKNLTKFNFIKFLREQFREVCEE